MEKDEHRRRRRLHLVGDGPAALAEQVIAMQEVAAAPAGAGEQPRQEELPLDLLQRRGVQRRHARDVGAKDCLRGVGAAKVVTGGVADRADQIRLDRAYRRRMKKIRGEDVVNERLRFAHRDVELPNGDLPKARRIREIDLFKAALGAGRRRRSRPCCRVRRDLGPDVLHLGRGVTAAAASLPSNRKGYEIQMDNPRAAAYCRPAFLVRKVTHAFPFSCEGEELPVRGAPADGAGHQRPITPVNEWHR